MTSYFRFLSFWDSASMAPLSTCNLQSSVIVSHQSLLESWKLVMRLGHGCQEDIWAELSHSPDMGDYHFRDLAFVCDQSSEPVCSIQRKFSILLTNKPRRSRCLGGIHGNPQFLMFNDQKH